jgi:hypothetical protein
MAELSRRECMRTNAGISKGVDKAAWPFLIAAADSN